MKLSPSGTKSHRPSEDQDQFISGQGICKMTRYPAERRSWNQKNGATTTAHVDGISLDLLMASLHHGWAISRGLIGWFGDQRALFSMLLF
ncbi:hypothetical protein E4U43_008225 [Claviceps pusilla]|uniref:Uncharacterized protein n=1 Tax=Claviceps pusilla TaxID=123648 RepID=A0A9P7NB88_9HYPO|nr:hypothetical protein E4U43_008225 [Claviceps pusilla]